MSSKFIGFFKNHGIFAIIIFALLIAIFSLSRDKELESLSEYKNRVENSNRRCESTGDSIIISSKLASFNLIEMPKISMINEHINSENLIPPSSGNEIERNNTGLLTALAFAIVKPFVEKRIDQYLLQLGFSRTIQESGSRESFLSKKEISLGRGLPLMCGQYVKATLLGRNTDNNFIFDTRHQKEPVNIEIGRNEFFKGLELGMIGMKAGGERIISIPKELSYCKNKDYATNSGANLEYLVKVQSIINQYNPEVLNIKTIDAVSSLDAVASCGDEALIQIKTYNSNGTLIEDLTDQSIKFIISSKKVPEAIELGIIGMRKNGIRLIIAPDNTMNIQDNMLKQILELREKDKIKMIEVKLVDLLQR